MISNTLWQKYIYNTPFDDEGLPLLNSRKSTPEPPISYLLGSSCYQVTEEEFVILCKNLQRQGVHSVVLINDYHFQSDNPIVRKGNLAHMMAFCFLFQQQGSSSYIKSKHSKR